MIPEAFLLMNAAVAIAAVTVAGVLGILINRGADKLTPQELMGVRFMIEHALLALFMSYLPILLQLYIPDASLVLSLASALFALSVTALWVLMARKTMRVTPRRPLTLRYGWFLPMGLLAILLSYNVFRPSAGNYCLALVTVLGMFSVQLLHFTYPPS